MGSGEQGIVDPGKAAGKDRELNAINIIQWSLYYPGVLDADELKLSSGRKNRLCRLLSRPMPVATCCKRWRNILPTAHPRRIRTVFIAPPRCSPPVRSGRRKIFSPRFSNRILRQLNVRQNWLPHCAKLSPPWKTNLFR